MFAQPDWFFFATQPAPVCSAAAPCITVPTTPPNNTFAWNHGGLQPEIATTWAGIVGPGVRHNGDDATWADHTDVRPTMLNLVGLRDTYVHDGRVLIDQLDASAVPQSLRAHRETLRRLGEVYKQLNAPFGTFSMSLLKTSTRAIKSGSSSNDSTYMSLENQIAELTAQRDRLASEIKAALDGAAFSDRSLNEQQAKRWIDAAQSLIDRAALLGG
jgi:outer membrane murein-binding lipoprotein Lpp